MKYFSLFSGIGGFEYGIEKAWQKYGQQNMRSDQPNTHVSKQDKKSSRRDGSKNPACVGSPETDKAYQDMGRITKTSNTKRRRNQPLSSRSYGKRWRTYAHCIGYSEIDKYATAIYRYHYPEHRNYGDATKIVSAELPDFDLLVGGFPCQSFSIAGKRKGMSGEDIRGTLFFEIWRIARDKRPHTLLLENVPGLFSSQSGKDFQAILRSLDEIGYDVEWDCLNSKNFGVPQSRPRVFIVGHIRGQGFKKVFPIRESVRVSETQDRGQQGKRQRISSTVASRYGALQNAGETYIMDENIDGNIYTYSYSPPLRSPNTIWNKKLLHKNRIRRLTPTECERLQAFPDGWTEYGIMDDEKGKISDTQRYKCLGNAVTTSVISAIVESLFKET